MVFAGSIDSDWKIEDKLTNIIRVLQGLIKPLYNCKKSNLFTKY